MASSGKSTESGAEGGAVDFAEALGRLVKDPTYRQEVEKQPQKLINDFAGLTVAEVGILISVWQSCLGAAQGGSMVSEAEGTYCCCCCCPHF